MLCVFQNYISFAPALSQTSEDYFYMFRKEQENSLNCNHQFVHYVDIFWVFLTLDV